MVTLKHPAFGDKVTREVDPEDVARWVASGWIDDREPEPEPEPDAVILPAPKPGPRKRATKNPSIGDD